MNNIPKSNVTNLHPEQIDTEPVQPPTLWNPIEPWHEHVGSEIFDEVEEFLNTHCYFHNPDDAFICGLWVAHANMFDEFEVTPRLLITAPFKAAGKTEVLKLLQNLTDNSVEGRNVTEATFVRLGGNHNLAYFMDEGDRVFRHETSDMTTVLNIGYEVGQSFFRCVGNENTPTAFPVSSAVAIAGKNLDTIMSDTTLSRSILIDMVKARKGQIRQKFKKKRHMSALNVLGRKLKRWCDDHRTDCGNYEPNFPDTLDDRDEDNWTSLVAIASVVSDEMGSRAMNIAIDKSALAEELEEDVLIRLLKDTKAVYDKLLEGMTSDDDNGVSIHCIQVGRLATELRYLHQGKDDGEQFWSWYNGRRNSGYWKDEDMPVKPMQLTDMFKKLKLLQTGKTRKSFKMADGKTMNGIGWNEFLKMYEQYLPDDPEDESIPDWCLEGGGTQVPEYSGVAPLQELHP